MKLIDVAKVGDYVDYNPLISEEKEYEGIPREHMNWRVLKTDGKNVILISEKPTKSVICLTGKRGYLDGPNCLNGTFGALYSSSYGYARNIQIEDVNEVLGYEVNKELVYGQEVEYGTNISDFEKLYHKNFMFRNTADGRDIGQYCHTYYWYQGNKYKQEDSIEYQLIFGEKSNYSYWLSSQCVRVCFNDGFALFCVRSINCVNVDARNLYHSNGYSDSASYACRPVVMLNSSVFVTNEQADGKTPSTAWKIK